MIDSMLKKFYSFLLAGFIAGVFGAGTDVYSQTIFGNNEKINDGWYFCLDSLSDYSGIEVEDGSWRKLDLPHDWSIEAVPSSRLASCTGYLPGGTGWYRKHIDIPASYNGGKVFLYFEGVYCNSDVWVNGRHVGNRPNGYVSFLYDVTDFLRFGEENVIAVRVDHSKYSDSRWYTGSGIYRDVYLVTSGNVHIDNWGVFARTADIRSEGADIAVSTSVCNESGENADIRIIHRVFAKDGSDILASSYKDLTVKRGKKIQDEQILTIDYPELWSPDRPYLYRVETVVMDSDSRQIDASTVVTGIRETRFDPDSGFFLNGVNMKMKGVCLHHDAGALGSAVPEPVWKRRLLTLKRLGVNAIRMSHNPQVDFLYDLCDELGFLVMDEAFDEWEFPKKKWVEGWNVGDSPSYQGYAEYFNDWAEKDLASMVMRDRNHPSIVLWSIGNEVDYPNDPYSHPILDHEGINQYSLPGYKPEKPRAERIGRIAEKLIKVVKDIDTSRSVTGAMAGVVMSNHTDYPFLLDVTGYNYTEDRYEMDHKTYPDRIIYGSENRHEYDHWCSVKDNDFIFGQFLWTGIDYLGEAGPYPSRGFICGLMDLGGFVRPRGYYRQSLWSEKPMAYIGTIRKNDINAGTLLFDTEPIWNYEPGDSIRVSVFSNCEKLRLSLNGEYVESEPEYDPVSNARYWDLEFIPGTISVKGLNAGKIEADYSISTHGQAESVAAYSDYQRISDSDGLVHVVAEILDKTGHRVMDSRHRVKFDVSGPGRLLKLENADPFYMGSFEGNELPAYMGRILAYVEVQEGASPVWIEITVPELGTGTEIRID